MNNERLKLLRRSSLRHEVDGSFDELEEFEDRREIKNRITHQECVMLNRVLSDKRKLPKACVLPVSSKTRNPPAPDQVAPPAESSSLGVLVRRFTGAVPDALSALNSLETKKELGGVVTEEQCRVLAKHLTPSVGGQYLLPGACTRILKPRDSDAELAEQYERENAEVYTRLKKRHTFVAKAGYPPTMC